MKPVKTTFRLDDANSSYAQHAGIEMELMFVPHKGLVMDVGDGNLREVRQVIYFPSEHAAHVWMESSPFDTPANLQQGGWISGYRP